jgi:hypothetical protein
MGKKSAKKVLFVAGLLDEGDKIDGSGGAGRG